MARWVETSRPKDWKPLACSQFTCKFKADRAFSDLAYGSAFDPLQGVNQSESYQWRHTLSRTVTDVVWGGGVCACVCGIIVSSLCSQQITSDVYVEVNPGIKRGRSSACCLCKLSVRGDFGCPTVPNTMKRLSLSVSSHKASARHPHQVQSPLISKPIPSTAGSQHKGAHFFHGICRIPSEGTREAAGDAALPFVNVQLVSCHNLIAIASTKKSCFCLIAGLHENYPTGFTEARTLNVGAYWQMRL